ncbi:hypothetical protein GCM10027565_05790 [Bordetella tumulicola]
MNRRSAGPVPGAYAPAIHSNTQDTPKALEWGYEFRRADASGEQAGRKRAAPRRPLSVGRPCE